MLAQNINEEVKKIGQNSRGIKTKLNENGQDYYSFIRETSSPAVIVEGVFVDNAEDINIADTIAKQKAFGYAYARGILKTLGITPKDIDVGLKPGATPTYKVQVGSFKERENATNQLNKAIEGGFTDAFIKEE